MSMKKNSLLLLVSSLFFFFSLSLASAALELGMYTNTLVHGSDGRVTVQFFIKNTGSEQVAATFILTDPVGAHWNAHSSGEMTFAPFEEKSLTHVLTFENPSLVKNTDALMIVRTRIPTSSETLIWNIPLIFTAPASITLPSPIPLTTPTTAIPWSPSRSLFCSNGTQGTNLTLRSTKIATTGEDKNEWKPFDEITVTTIVENTGRDHLEDVVVELGLFDSEGRNVADDVLFKNKGEERINLGRLSRGDDEKVTFVFSIPLGLEPDTYEIVLKAFSEDIPEARICVETPKTGSLTAERVEEKDKSKF